LTHVWTEGTAVMGVAELMDPWSTDPKITKGEVMRSIARIDRQKIYERI